MSASSVVDANCIKYFHEERITGQEDIFTSMIEHVFLKGVIAIDDVGLAEQEYISCCQPSAIGINLQDWIAEKLIEFKIVPFSMDNTL